MILSKEHINHYHIATDSPMSETLKFMMAILISVPHGGIMKDDTDI